MGTPANATVFFTGTVVVDSSATLIDDLKNTIEAIGTELGVNPSGVYPSTRIRLDILEARINNPLVPAPNVENPFFIGNDGVTISTGLGTPTEDRIDGSLYLRQDGYVYEGLYSRRDGYWKRIDTDPWTANGDLSGTYDNQTVIGLQGRDLSSTLPLDGYHLTWNYSNSIWEPQIGFFANNDLSGSKMSQTVVGIQNRSVANTLPSDGYVLTWNYVADQWQPRASAVIFDTTTNLNNIKANRNAEISIVDNAKTGIVNFGNNAVAYDNYVTVTGGYQILCNFQYSLIGGGGGNTITAPGSYSSTDGYSVIAGGSSNSIELGSFCGILGGVQNYIKSLASIIVGGYNNNINAVSGSFNTIVDGYTNNIQNSNFCTIVSGQLNYINATSSTIVGGSNGYISSNDCFIGSGQDGSINGSSRFSTVLNGDNNTVLNSFAATIIAGENNHIENGSLNVIVSGDSNTVQGNKSAILDGYSNSVNASYSTIVNGDGNSVTSNYCTILNGVDNSINVNSNDSAILNGAINYIENSEKIVISGDDNYVDMISDTAFVFGTSNSLSDSTFANIFGFQNTTGSGSYLNVIGANNQTGNSITYTNIFGYDNLINNDVNLANVFGYQNQLSTATSPADLLSTVFGRNNQLIGQHSFINGSDNYLKGDYSFVLGDNNSSGDVSNAVDFSIVHGVYGKSNYHGQYVHSSGNLSTFLGASQYSRLIVDGYANAGAAFTLDCLGDTLQFEDYKSYDITIRLLVVNTSGSATCARYVYDILAHQESGTLVLDNVNNTILNDNGTGWTVTLSAATNQLSITIDSSGVLNRRAMATIEWRELSRD